jgi:phage portal protein BeeE
MHKPGDNLVYFDGVKSTPLSEIRNWDAFFGGESSGSAVAPLAAFKTVPWLFRAVDLRAKAVQKMPFALYKRNGSTDISEQAAYAPLARRLRALLLLSEASLALHARTYWALETNQFGGNLTPRWIVPTSVTPKFDGGDVSGFTRHINGREIPLRLDQVLYSWVPSLEHDLGPGHAPAAVACHAAGVLHNLDRYLDAYFARGAIRATLLQIEGNPPDAEKRRLEAWWKRMLGGVKQAFETAAISAAVKPIVIGDSLKETVNKELTQQERENVATAMGVPHSLLFSNAANFATAQQDMFNLYDGTIVPECELLEGPINEQYLSRIGLRLEFQPERLPCYQVQQVQLAAGLVPFISSGTVDQNEIRSILGLPPKQIEAPASPSSIPATAAARANIPDEQSPAPSAKATDLDKWQRKALKRLQRGQPAACSFESDYLSAAEHAAIRDALTHATTPAAVKTAFATSGRVTRDDLADLLDDDLIAAAAQLVEDAQG